MGYYNMLRNCKDKRYYRLDIVKYAKKYGIKPAARKFDTTPKTVRKWVRRFDGKLDSLADQSHAPKNPKTYITAEQRMEAIQLKKKYPSWGAKRLKREFNLTISEKAILKIWREEGLIKRKRRKQKTKKYLRELKKKWKFCQQIEHDVKYLFDIPEYWPQMKKKNLPLYQYTFREVTSELQYIAFAQERALTYTNLHIELILEHLKKCGVNLKRIKSVVQTDNGSEYIGSWHANYDSKFTETVEGNFKIIHKTIPPGAHTYQADVETVHRLIEDEFYELEKYTSRRNFLDKAFTYQLWFNVARKNSGKEYQTPWDIIHKKNPKVNPNVVLLPPVFLDEVFDRTIEEKNKGGYDLIPHP